MNTPSPLDRPAMRPYETGAEAAQTGRKAWAEVTYRMDNAS